jgi:hypothetical protein
MVEVRKRFARYSDVKRFNDWNRVAHELKLKRPKVRRALLEATGSGIGFP